MTFRLLINILIGLCLDCRCLWRLLQVVGIQLDIYVFICHTVYSYWLFICILWQTGDTSKLYLELLFLFKSSGKVSVNMVDTSTQRPFTVNIIFTRQEVDTISFVAIKICTLPISPPWQAINYWQLLLDSILKWSVYVQVYYGDTLDLIDILHITQCQRKEICLKGNSYLHSYRHSIIYKMTSLC